MGPPELGSGEWSGRAPPCTALSICGTRLTSGGFCVLEWQGADFSGEHLLIPAVSPAHSSHLGWRGHPRAVLSRMHTLRKHRPPNGSGIHGDLVLEKTFF